MLKYQLDKSDRRKITNLVISRVYHRDTVENFKNTKPEKANNFLWKIFMKYECRMLNQESYLRVLNE